MIEGLQEGAQNQAAICFAKGDELAKHRRKTLVRAFGKMNFTQAWCIAKDYAMGKVNEVGNDLKNLVHAWLVLGERRFRIVFSVVRAFNNAKATGTLILRRLIDQLQALLPKASVEDIRADVESLQYEFRFVTIV